MSRCAGGSDATRFVDWLPRDSGAVYPGIAARPTPTLSIDVSARRGVISGVRFHHSIRCRQCHELVYLYTDGGSVTAGLETYGKRRVRRFEVHSSNGFPAMPKECPNPGCASQDRPFHRKDISHISPCSPEPVDMLNEIWRRLRSEFPALWADSAKAETRHRLAPLPRRTAAASDQP